MWINSVPWIENIYFEKYNVYTKGMTGIVIIGPLCTRCNRVVSACSSIADGSKYQCMHQQPAKFTEHVH